MRKMRICAAAICLLLILTALCSCGLPALPEGFDRDEVIETARTVVTYIAFSEYDMVADMFSPEMAAALDGQGLRDALSAPLEKIGAYEKVVSETVFGQSSETIGDYAVVVLVAKHTDGQATYTVSIDSEGRICGLYMK